MDGKDLVNKFTLRSIVIIWLIMTYTFNSVEVISPPPEWWVLGALAWLFGKEYFKMKGE